MLYMVHLRPSAADDKLLTIDKVALATSGFLLMYILFFASHQLQSCVPENNMVHI